jgi:hypothetical protein
MSGTGRVWIAVSPEVAYAAVADLTRMGEWSPENYGGEWVEGEAAVGATFRGRNRGPHGEWETLLTVVDAQPPSRFAFCVAAPGEAGTTWRYTFRVEHGGTAVEESFEWHWTPLPKEGFRGRIGRLPIDDAVRQVGERERHLQDQVEQTLATLKHVLEAEAGTI